jgi:hypothetical protein
MRKSTSRQNRLQCSAAGIHDHDPPAIAPGGLAGICGRIDADTLFAIASNTKPFTTAAPAILVDEGRLHWDTRSSTTSRSFGSTMRTSPASSEREAYKTIGLAITDAYVRFREDFAGAVEGFAMQAVSADTDFSFDFRDLGFHRVAAAPAP